METDFGPVCREHIEFMKWADNIMLSALSNIHQDQLYLKRGNSFESLFDTLNHVYLAELVWFRRVTDEPNARIVDQPSPTDLAGLASAWPALHQQWIAWATPRSATEWALPLVYSNLPGTESRVPFYQILLHLVNHGTYHRGQVATMLRQAGIKPPGTDLILFYKSRQ